MSAVFTPPVVLSTPQYLDETTSSEPTRGPARRLMRYYPPGPEGRAVWRLTDGTYTATQPYPTTEATVSWVYYGAHDYLVSDAEAAALTAAGFTVTNSTPGDGLGGVGDTFTGQGLGFVPPVSPPPPPPPPGTSGYGQTPYGEAPYGS